MFDIKDILLMVKQAAKDTYNSMKPAEILFGTVESINPLVIKVGTNLILESIQLILTRNVIDYDLEMTVDHITEVGNGPEGHTHGYKGRKIFRVNNALIQGEKVMLIRVQGGQKYVVYDKVVDA
ncbi:hypothetical protein CLPUN_03050 [Clostridium puniceum]|uniref:DUF2577 domain-containing protein n=1 Tax=Clostridium puniceum TaxID=29367 RepID=A0A1S8TX58_9CLOT|nr:DUF2577 domain-containing protein [Clostridium puniceum]OOM82336.1 hypothetical protein CLPUN_03050 [Clostridium puniceum]